MDKKTTKIIQPINASMNEVTDKTSKVVLKMVSIPHKRPENLPN